MKSEIPHELHDDLEAVLQNDAQRPSDDEISVRWDPDDHGFCRAFLDHQIAAVDSR
jgi:hypothetical protein